MTTEESIVVQIPFESDESRWSKQSIYKIPESIVASNSTSNSKPYHPQMLSIGPYHYGATNLQKMETHKLRALQNVESSGKTLDYLCQNLHQYVVDLKGAYDELDKGKWSDKQFVELMVRDGCFILELLRKSAADDQTPWDAYPKNDPIFSKHGLLNIVPYLKRDMLMLENQIPMMVLKELDNKIYPPDQFKTKEGLIKRIRGFFYLPNPLSCPEKVENSLHILELYRESLISRPKETGDNRNTNNSSNNNSNNSNKKSNSEEKGSQIPGHSDNEIIRSATELNNAGVTIKRSKSNSLRDISFKKGLFGAQLTLPLIIVDDAFESLYLNLIAYERFHVKTGEDNAVTAYLILMDKIIDDVQDVALLHSSQVIQNALSSDKALAKLFNSLCTDSTLDPTSDLGQVHGKVSKFCEKKGPRWRAYCCQQYCSNPLVAITVLAAILIFVMTVVQTGYNVFDHIK